MKIFFLPPCAFLLMSRPPLLGVGVKDLLQQYLRNPLNLRMGLLFCWTFKPTKRGVNSGHEQGEQQSHTPHWEVWRRHHAREEISEGISRISAGPEWGCEMVGAAQHKASPGFHTEIQGCFRWPSAGVAEGRRTLSSCCSHLHSDRQTYGNDCTANLTFFNHVTMFHLRINAPNVCFVRKLNQKSSNESQKISRRQVLSCIDFSACVRIPGPQGWAEATDRFLEAVDWCCQCHLYKSAISQLISVTFCWIYTWQQTLTLSTWSEQGHSHSAETIWRFSNAIWLALRLDP